MNNISDLYPPLSGMQLECQTRVGNKY